MHLDEHALVRGRAVQIADHRRLGGGAFPRFAQQRLVDPPAGKQRLSRVRRIGISVAAPIAILTSAAPIDTAIPSDGQSSAVRAVILA
jgi:hypothetical protein